MSITGLNKTVGVGEISVTARELTVSEIRAWFARLAEPTQPDAVVDVLLFRDLSVADICATTDLTPEALATLTPSQVDQVITAIKEVNPSFFGLRARLAELGSQAQQQAQQPAASSSETSAP